MMAGSDCSKEDSFMSEFRIWISILGWAAFAVVVSIGACHLALRLDPTLSGFALGIIAMLAVHLAYSVRNTMRDLGWARQSYAPRDAA